MKYYTISVQKDGSRVSEDGLTGTREQVIDNLIDKLHGDNVDLDAIRSDMEERGLYHSDRNCITYTLVALPFSESRIKPLHSGFGEYQVESSGDYWADEADLLDAMRSGMSDEGGKLLELGKDALPTGIEDIRGRIHNEPSRVFAMVDEDGELIGYTSIVEG